MTPPSVLTLLLLQSTKLIKHSLHTHTQKHGAGTITISLLHISFRAFRSFTGKIVQGSDGIICSSSEMVKGTDS